MFREDKTFHEEKKMILPAANNPVVSLTELMFDGILTNRKLLENQLEQSLPSLLIKDYSLFKRTKLSMANELLVHVLKGQPEKVKEILEKQPNLLLVKGKVTDQVGRMMNATAFQGALAALDVNVKKNLGMAEIIMDYFEKLPDGNKEALDQFNEQFPDGIEEEKEYDFEPLTNALSNCNNWDEFVNDEKSKEAFKHFQINFKRGIVDKGKLFNLPNLINAMKILDDINYTKLPCYYELRDFFWLNVIRYLQTLLPVNVAQLLCGDLWSILDHDKPFVRSLEMRYGDDPDDKVDFYSELTDKEKYVAYYTFYQRLPSHAYNSFGFAELCPIYAGERTAIALQTLYDIQLQSLKEIKEQLQKKSQLVLNPISKVLRLSN